MGDCRNCIYFEEQQGEMRIESYPYHCKRTSTLYSQAELDSGTMGKNCRLWDAFIPLDATSEQIKYAQDWQDMSYNEQPDYKDYFKED